MVPAHECFDARDVSARQPNDGLILEYELTAFDCALEGGGEIQPLERGGMQGRFIQLVPVVVQPRIHQHRAIFARIEPESLNRRHASLIENRPLAPGLASIGGDQKKWIPRRALQIPARNPSILKVDELDLIENRALWWTNADSQ